MIESLAVVDLAEVSKIQPEGWTAITPYYQFYLNSPFCFPLKIERKGKIAAVGCGIFHGNSGWLGHIITASPFRGQGLGFKMVEALKKILQSRGAQTISLIATDMGHPLYLKAGFREQRNYKIYKGDKLYNGELSSNIMGYIPSFKAEVLKLDRSISGEDREVLLTPHLEKSFIHRRASRLEGLFIPGLGEGLILAEDKEAGKELMKLRLTMQKNAALPEDNRVGSLFLKEMGLTRLRTGKRMVWGKEFPWIPQGIYNRIGGHLG